MRLPLIPPAQLTPQQKALYDELREGIASNLNAFKAAKTAPSWDRGTRGCMTLASAMQSGISRRR
jgi:hypothetical protein